MTKKVKGRILKAALTLAAVCALTVPSMTIRADKTAEAGDDTQVIQTAVQVQDTVQPSGTGQAAGEEAVPLPVADPEEYTGQLQDIRPDSADAAGTGTAADPDAYPASGSLRH